MYYNLKGLEWCHGCIIYDYTDYNGPIAEYYTYCFGKFSCNTICNGNDSDVCCIELKREYLYILEMIMVRRIRCKI